MHPLHLTQNRAILDDILIRRQQHLEVARPDLALQYLPLRRVALVRDHLDARRPLCELARPVRHGRERHDDEVRPALLLDLDKVGNERDRLNRLAETLCTRTSERGLPQIDV